jgi:hypothetical protein
VIEGEVADVEGEWAAVVFWHSLEHLAAPGPAIDRAPDLHSTGGCVVVAVPNPASLQARVFGDRWFHLDLPRHLVHLPASALTARLRSLGLEIDRVSHCSSGDELSKRGTVRK